MNPADPSKKKSAAMVHSYGSDCWLVTTMFFAADSWCSLPFSVTRPFTHLSFLILEINCRLALRRSFRVEV